MNKNSFFILMAGVLWGTMGVFFNILKAKGFSEMQIVFLRASTSLLVMSVYLLMKDRAAFRIRIKDAWCFVGSGIVGMVLCNYCFFSCVKGVSLAVGEALMYTSPMFVTVFSALFFHERVTGRQTAILLFAVAGCLLVTGIGGGQTGSLKKYYLLLGLLSGVFYALYSIFSKFAVEMGYRPVTAAFYAFLTASVSSLVMSGSWQGTAFAGSDTYVGIIGIGIGGCLLPYVLYTAGLKGTNASRAAVLATVEPIVGALISSVFYHESLFNLKGLGIIVILTAIVLLSAKKPA